MRANILFATLVCMILFSVSEAQRDRERWGLEGRIRYVEQFETNFCCTPNERIEGPRRLTNVTSFDRKGNFKEWISINNDIGGPTYERRIFVYDRRGRKVLAEVFRSDPNPPNTFFEVVIQPDGSPKLVPERAESLIQRITFAHNSRGDLTEEITRDRDENLIRHNLYRYDQDGRMIRATVLTKDSAIENESITIHFEGGRRSETTTIQPGQKWAVQRSTTDRDERGRIVRGDAYRLKQDSPGEALYVLTSRTVYTFIGKLDSRMDWTFFHEDGRPDRKLVIINNERGDETSRDEYSAHPPLPGSMKEDVDPEWNLQRRNLRKRTYDKRGNEIRLEWWDQCGPDLPMELTTIYERVITYY